MQPTLRPKPASDSFIALQIAVFALVAAAFTNIYITQPLLPVLQVEFQTSISTISASVSAVILGITLANLPFGALADRVAIRPIIAGGSLIVALAGSLCFLSHDLKIFLAARFLQGLFIPSLTTCLAACLARQLPPERLNVVMGSYVAATVCGGLGGRLLGGFINELWGWRYALLAAAGLIATATVLALPYLPGQHAKSTLIPNRRATPFLVLLSRPELRLFYLLAACSFAIFSTLFNYLPFRLAGPVFQLAPTKITLLYLVYVVGIFTGPSAGRMVNRFGTAPVIGGGALIFMLSLALLFLPFISAIIAGLLGVCAGFFTLHAAAVGAINRNLTQDQGRANALYVLSYYLGGYLGISLSGLIYENFGWPPMLLFCVLLLAPAFYISSRRKL